MGVEKEIISLEEVEMNRGVFNSKYLCSLDSAIRTDTHLYKLAMDYHRRTESFDQTVCTSKNRKGIATPSNIRELMLINQNAMIIKREILKTVLEKGFTKDEFTRMISNTSHVFEQEYSKGLL